MNQKDKVLEIGNAKVVLQRRWKMREHDKVVKELKDMLKSKGIECLSFHRNAAWIMKKGSLNAKTEICAFIPDITVKDGETDEDVIIVEYIHSKRQLRSDARGLALLSCIGYKAHSFLLVLNDDIIEYDRGTFDRLHVHQMSLSMFKKSLREDSKESFLSFIRIP